MHGLNVELTMVSCPWTTESMRSNMSWKDSALCSYCGPMVRKHVSKGILGLKTAPLPCRSSPMKASSSFQFLLIQILRFFRTSQPFSSPMYTSSSGQADWTAFQSLRVLKLRSNLDLSTPSSESREKSLALLFSSSFSFPIAHKNIVLSVESVVFCGKP